jgi:hypothetical protein
MKSVKTKVLLYNEFQSLWHSISVEKKEYEPKFKIMYMRLLKLNLLKWK